jgi:hypothetical protein
MLGKDEKLKTGALEEKIQFLVGLLEKMKQRLEEASKDESEVEEDEDDLYFQHNTKKRNGGQYGSSNF